ncbi:DUF2071 domain-containing protein [Lacisediminihabitans sp.]|uniref:YqjF family protein n=1 Tax=Lacisediminihabitans sp. TaxID=2787631 RepID=UPI002F95CAF0
MEPISQTAPALPGRAILEQFWADLTFIHWRVDAALVAPLLPAGVVPDVFDGSSWVGLIPFRMASTAALGGPPVPYFGEFTEVNVRLYAVDVQGRRGVVFTSLEASRLAAVLGARAAFSIPYFWAAATFDRVGDELRYSSRRHSRKAPASRVVSRPSDVRVLDDPLADFLTARWRLFVRRGCRTLVIANRHPPWPLFVAELVSLHDELLTASGLPGISSRPPDSVLYSPGVLTQFSGPEVEPAEPTVLSA